MSDDDKNDFPGDDSRRNSDNPKSSKRVRRRETLQITERPISSLKPSPHNARRHSPMQIAQIKASIARFGFLTAVLVDGEGTILAGHGRVMAARELGITAVPTVEVTDLTPEETRAYMLADNKIALNAEWDERILADELTFLSVPELDFPVELTGFSTAELDLILDGTTEPAPDPADEVEIPTGPPVSRVGDLWLLGPHRLLCGSALERTSYVQLMCGERAQLVVTDPPYNVKINGHVGGGGKIRQREFVMASGEMSDPEFTEFLRTAFTRIVENADDGAIAFAFMDWRHIRNVLDAGQSVFTELKNLIVWNKMSGGMGSFYRSQHELCFAFKVGSAPHINNFRLGETGRYRANVWNYPGASTFKRGRLADLAMHPTVKPLSMIADAIRDCSKRKGIVLDPFAGSGTILLAAEKTGRMARAIELDPIYVDTAISRWEKQTGGHATLADSGMTFAAVRHGRDQITS